MYVATRDHPFFPPQSLAASRSRTLRGVRTTYPGKVQYLPTYLEARQPYFLSVSHPLAASLSSRRLIAPPPSPGMGRF